MLSQEILVLFIEDSMCNFLLIPGCRLCYSSVFLAVGLLSLSLQLLLLPCSNSSPCCCCGLELDAFSAERSMLLFHHVPCLVDNKIFQV